MRLPAWLARMSRRLQGRVPTRPIDLLWMQMWRGENADGSTWSIPKTGRDRFLFLPHQNKRERRRRMRQAATWRLAPEQFYNRDEWKEAQEMYVVMIEAERAA